MRAQLLDALAFAGELNDRLHSDAHPRVWAFVDGAVSTGICALDDDRPFALRGRRVNVGGRITRSWLILPNNWPCHPRREPVGRLSRAPHEHPSLGRGRQAPGRMSHAATLPRARRRRRKPPRLLIALAIVLVEVLMLAWSVEHAVTGSDRVWALILIGVYVYLLSQDWPKLLDPDRRLRLPA